MEMGRYLDILKALPYEFNEFNEFNLSDGKKPRQEIGEVTNLIPTPSSEGTKFVTPQNSSEEKTASQSFYSLNSLNSYLLEIPDLTTFERHILERATKRECSFLIDLLTDSSLNSLQLVQQAVSTLLSRGLLERSHNGRGGTWLYSLPKRARA